MDLFKSINIEKEENSIAFLIEEALEDKAHFAESGQNALEIKPIIKNTPIKPTIMDINFNNVK